VEVILKEGGNLEDEQTASDLHCIEMAFGKAQIAQRKVWLLNAAEEQAQEKLASEAAQAGALQRLHDGGGYTSIFDVDGGGSGGGGGGGDGDHSALTVSEQLAISRQLSYNEFVNQELVSGSPVQLVQSDTTADLCLSHSLHLDPNHPMATYPLDPNHPMVTYPLDPNHPMVTYPLDPNGHRCCSRSTTASGRSRVWWTG
jgi:hypothetical protein